MEIVSSDDADADDNDKSFFDRVMVLCHDSFSDSSSDGEDKEEALFVWGGSTQERCPHFIIYTTEPVPLRRYTVNLIS